MKHHFCYLILTIIFFSCGNNTIPEEKYLMLSDIEKKYAEDFEYLYGKPSEEITWMTVADLSVELDLSKLPEGKYDATFYTDDPTAISDKCFITTVCSDLAGEAKHSVAIDFPIGLKTVYVSVIDQYENVFVGKSDISDVSPIQLQVENTPISGSIGTHRPMCYNICYEAYAPTLDFDYNDAVIELEYVRGLDTMPVKLRAVGSSYWTKIVYRREKNNVSSDETIFAEAHGALGYPASYNFATGKNEYIILNTGINDTGRTASTLLDLKEDQGVSICDIAPKMHMYIKTNEKSEELSDYYLHPEKGSPCPQAFMVSAPDWVYAVEDMFVDIPYPEFIYWVPFTSKVPWWYTKIWEDEILM